MQIPCLQSKVKHSRNQFPSSSALVRTRFSDININHNCQRNKIQKLKVIQPNWLYSVLENFTSLQNAFFKQFFIGTLCRRLAWYGMNKEGG